MWIPSLLGSSNPRPPETSQIKQSNLGQIVIQYNTVKPNLKGLAVLLRFRDSFGFKKAKKEKKNSGLDISFGSSNKFGLNFKRSELRFLT